MLTLLVEGARSVGFLRELKDQTYVDLDGALASIQPSGEPGPQEGAPAMREPTPEAPVVLPSNPEPAAPGTRGTSRVFITHGRNKEIVEQLKDLLNFGGFTPVIAMENETTSKPLPDKVMDDMKSCGAAIIHVGAEAKLIDSEGKEQKMLNQNVLIEIGAALALYGRKFILLVEQGVTLPTNLRGLYEVRYQGEKLDYEATMKLLKAFADFRA